MEKRSQAELGNEKRNGIDKVSIDMGMSRQSWRLAIAGLNLRGHFFRERWQLLNPGRVVALADDVINSSSMPVVRVSELINRPTNCTAVLVALPVWDRGSLIAELLSAGLSVLVEPPIATSRAEALALFELAHARDVALRVVALRRSEPDFHAAASALGTGRLGRLDALRWYAAEYAVWAGSTATQYRRSETLAVAGPPIFDQLAGLTTAEPHSVWAREFPAEDGFATDIAFQDGSTAYIELRRTARVGLRTGWIMEGAAGSYHQRRIITTTADGELVDESVTADNPSIDPLQELEAMDMLAPMSAAERSRSIVTAGLLESVRRSITTNASVAWDAL